EAPPPCACTRRTESIVPQQALALTNSRLMIDHSRLLARKLVAQVPTSIKDEAERQTAFIRLAFEQVLTRSPTERELTVCREFVQKQEELYRQGKAQPVKAAGATLAPPKDPAKRARGRLDPRLLNPHLFLPVQYTHRMSF